SRRRHTRSKRDWSSDVCSSDLPSGPNNELRIYFANLGDSGTNAQMAALRVDLNNNPERDEYAVFTHEGAVRLKALVPVDDVYPRSEERRVGRRWQSGRWRDR